MGTMTFYAKKLEKELLAIGIKQYVREATRITENSQTVIDLVFSNSKRICVKNMCKTDAVNNGPCVDTDATKEI